MSSQLLAPSSPTIETATKLRVVVSGLPSDSHTWNLVYIDMVVGELGHDVINLGPCVPERLLVRECGKLAPDLVVLSTVNGHGFADGVRVVKALRRHRRLTGTPIVIGGTLTTSGRTDRDLAEALLAAGFTQVFSGEGDLDRFREYVGGLAASVPC